MPMSHSIRDTGSRLSEVIIVILTNGHSLVFRQFAIRGSSQNKAQIAVWSSRSSNNLSRGFLGNQLDASSRIKDCAARWSRDSRRILIYASARDKKAKRFNSSHSNFPLMAIEINIKNLVADGKL